MKEKAYLIIIGILIASFGFYAWDFYRLNKQVTANTQDIKAVIDFLNSQIKPNQPAQANPQ